MTRAALLSAQGIAMSYPRQQGPALVDVSIDVARGEIVGLSGPSGSGKTSLLMVLLGWEQPDAASISWAGKGVSSLGALSWTEVAVVPQTLGLASELSLRENVELPLILAGSRNLDPAHELIEDFQLSDVADRRPRESSVGEQQRAAIARALVGSPLLLIADEPTGHQDGARKRKIFERCRRQAEEGTAVLMASHDAEALAGCDRVIHLRSGRVVAELTS